MMSHIMNKQDYTRAMEDIEQVILMTKNVIEAADGMSEYDCAAGALAGLEDERDMLIEKYGNLYGHTYAAN